MTAVLRTEGLTVVGTDRQPIVEGIDLELQAGELVALLGVNGSGKTTLVRALAGLVPPTTGRIVLEDGSDVSARRHAAYLPQLARPVPWRDAVRNAALPIEASGVQPRMARRVAREALAASEPALLRRGGRRGAGLSGASGSGSCSPASWHCTARSSSSTNRSPPSTPSSDGPPATGCARWSGAVARSCS